MYIQMHDFIPRYWKLINFELQANIDHIFKKIYCIWICPHLQIFEYVSKGKHQSVNRDRAGENVNEIISQKSYVTRDHPIAASQAGDS